MDELLAQADALLEKADSGLLKRRIEVWKLRIKGYTLLDIAERLGVSYGTAQGDYRWALENIPPAFASREEFMRLSLQRLEWQVKMLGQTLERLQAEGEDDIATHRTILAVQDMQAKLLGAYTVNVDVSTRVNHIYEGVDVDKV